MTFDLVEGYNQVEMIETYKPLCAFATDCGLFEQNVMTFGLTNAPATFQRMMNDVLGEELDKCCLVYLDDVLIFSNSREAHFRDVYVVCFRLATAGSRLKWEKCRVEQMEVEYLGNVITKGRIKPSPSKEQKIFDFQQPTSVKQLRGPRWKRKSSFLEVERMSDHYHHREPRGRGIADAEFRERIHTVYGCLWRRFGGRIVSGEQEQKLRLVAFYSRKLKASERKYAIGEKEPMAIVFAMEHYKVYLYGKEFVVRTDHRPLQWLKDRKNPTTRLGRLLIIARQFAFRIEFVSGTQNAAADELYWITSKPKNTQQQRKGTKISRFWGNGS